MNKRSLGSDKEQLAAEFLEKQGYYIRERNFRCRQGEIDIIAQDGRYLVFVEVKYRADGRSGEPEEAVTAGKQRTIRRVAEYYLHRYRFSENTPCRFDVVGIKGEEIRITKNAF
ncbi:MAG: YraN family protein [Lachnospiraceae bacterium]|nr:YraN family protein [Lachnospiraceae bacterium]